MARYIDADALIPMMKYATTDSEVGIFPIRIGFKDIVKVINDMSTADVRENVRGEWAIEDCHAATYKYCCSNCKAHHRAMYDFCPSCGADMRERSTDETD